MKNQSLLFTILLFVVFAFGTTIVKAQVAINTTGNNAASSAMLDVSSSNMGILIPRVVLNDVNTDTPVEDPSVGLLIFNQGGTEEEGFYYWNGTKWLFLMTNSSPLESDQVFGVQQMAELYENNSFSSPTVIDLTSDDTCYGWVSANEGELIGSMTTDTANTTADQIIISEDGLYEIEISSSFGGATSNFRLTAAVWHTPSGGTATETRVKFMTRIGSYWDVQSGTANGFLELSAGDVLDIRFNSKRNYTKLEIYTFNFVVNKVGED